MAEFVYLHRAPQPPRVGACSHRPTSVFPMSSDRYTIISADTHAGGSHAEYREYLDPAYLEDFDAWRGKYKNPYKDLKDTDLRVRNWDNERRWKEEESDGVVAGV